MIAWAKGGSASVTRFAEPLVVVRSTIAAAPGTPLEGVFAAASERIVVKVKSCKRDGDGFVIEGRLVNLTRELRAALTALPPS